MTILEEIAEYTKARIEKEKKQISTNELRTLAEKMNENEGFVFEDAIRIWLLYVSVKKLLRQRG